MDNENGKLFQEMLQPDEGWGETPNPSLLEEDDDRWNRGGYLPKSKRKNLMERVAY